MRRSLLRCKLLGHSYSNASEMQTVSEMQEVLLIVQNGRFAGTPKAGDKYQTCKRRSCGHHKWWSWNGDWVANPK